MAVANVHILYVGSSAYDLRKVSSIVAHQTDPLLVMARFYDDPRTAIPFVKATFEAAWQASLDAGGGIVPTGPAGGDLGDTYPNPRVVAIQGVAVQAAAPVTGAQLIFNSATGQYEPSFPIRYFASGALAQAAAPFINGTSVVIYPGSPTSEAGTYRVTANNGATFPTDYTKISDATDTASEVSITDAGGFYPAPKNVEVALQAAAQGNITMAAGILPVGLTVMASVAAASAIASEWLVVLTNGTLRYKTTLSVVHDGALANTVESAIVVGPGVDTVPVTLDASILTGNLRITATASGAGWTYRIRSTALVA